MTVYTSVSLVWTMVSWRKLYLSAY